MIAFYGLVSVLLIWAAVEDVKNRIVPGKITLPFLILCLSFLFVDKQYWLASFYILVIYGSRSINAIVPSIIIALVLWSTGGLDNNGDLAFIVGMYFVTTLFYLGWFGGADAQIAYGLMAISRDWWMVGFLLGGTILVGITIMFVQRGWGGGIKRAVAVGKNLDRAYDDPEAVRTPWLLIATFISLIYFWVTPGIY